MGLAPLQEEGSPSITMPFTVRSPLLKLLNRFTSDSPLSTSPLVAISHPNTVFCFQIPTVPQSQTIQSLLKWLLTIALQDKESDKISSPVVACHAVVTVTPNPCIGFKVCGKYRLILWLVCQSVAKIIWVTLRLCL
jgi:hypothetical protein